MWLWFDACEFYYGEHFYSKYEQIYTTHHSTRSADLIMHKIYKQKYKYDIIYQC